MKKRLTRKKLLEEMDLLVEHSRTCPVIKFVTYFTDENGAWLWDDKIELDTLDEISSLLMDKSVFHRIVHVSSSGIPFMNGLRVMFTLSPDKECKTNIDVDFMEKLLKMEVYRG